jgi:tyrosine-protein phosphatase SIW14
MLGTPPVRMPLMPNYLRCTFAALIAALLIAGPWWYKGLYERHYRNFHVVTPGKLYRSGQLDAEGLKDMVRLYDIKTIVCLRDAESETSQQEEKWAAGQALNYVRIQQKPWRPSAGFIPAEEGLRTFRNVMRDPRNYPVLVHCFAGMHRTGAYCAVYRMDFEGWTTRAALAEMRLMGYQTLDEDVDILDYLANYRPQPERPPVVAQPVLFSPAP